MAIQKISKRLLSIGILSLAVVLSACGTVSEQAEPEVNIETPTNYAEYKRWRDQYDPEGKAFAEYKAWEEQYRRWQWQQQQAKP